MDIEKTETKELIESYKMVSEHLKQLESQKEAANKEKENA